MLDYSIKLYEFTPQHIDGTHRIVASLDQDPSESGTIELRRIMNARRYLFALNCEGDNRAFDLRRP